MRKSTALLAGLALPALVVLAQPPSQPPVKPGQPPQAGTPSAPTRGVTPRAEDPAFRDALVAEEKKVWETIKAEDWTTFEGFMGDGFTLVTPNGFEDRTATIAECKKDRLASFTLTDFRVTKLGENNGIVMYQAEQ